MNIVPQTSRSLTSSSYQKKRNI